SPAYDMNPTPIEIKAHILSMAIDFNDTSASLETAMAVSKDFRLSKDKASEIIKEVGAAVKKWRQVAFDVGLSKRECDRMTSAFVHDAEVL
ncbi:MAG TPA: type II toxin-antitoxin system HipA family toxin, partial [Gammaproteobacteria bacterium]|nr:type II toxin-antitoxin system HipA family toxin [Gammaproteobacteria bacterium]